MAMLEMRPSYAVLIASSATVTPPELLAVFDRPRMLISK
jgi:hypothetical protein